MHINEIEVSRVIEMAWEDRTPFDAIKELYDLNQGQVEKLMRRDLSRSAFRSWRKRVSGRKTKHVSRRPSCISRMCCPTQYKP